MPVISVLVATYNQGQHLRRCLDSLLSQTVPKESYELVVVNDGSTDNTKEVMEGYGPRIRPIHFPQNQGLPAACNAGLCCAEGEYVVRVDSDDWVEAEALDLLSSSLDLQHGVDILLPDYWQVNDLEHVRRSPDPNNVFTWLACGSMMPRDMVLAAGSYRSLFWEEYDLYLRMLKEGARVARLAHPILFYRTHSDSMTARGEARLEGWRELLQYWPAKVLRQWGYDEELEQIITQEACNQ